MSTLFNLPEACLYADLVEHLEKQLHIDLIASKSNTEGKLSFLSLFQDIRSAMDHVHLGGKLKDATLENLEKYLQHFTRITL
jgi:5'-nucleotidase